jgi:glycosyltransferase involved in cell wall biosynthesis
MLGEAHMNDDIPEGVLSVIMPVYNEASTVSTILAHVLRRPEVKEVLVVDDGSTDGSWEVIQEVAAGEPRVRAFRQERNRGKGTALRLVIPYLTAPFALVQDADLEYDPDDYPRLLAPLLAGRADAVNGVRGFGAHTAYSYWFVKGNQLLTTLLNLLFNCYITDLLSGYKVLRTELWRRLNLQSRGFEVETEIVAKVLRLGYRFHEVPITYITRSRADGKKIRARHALQILRMQLRVRCSPARWLFGSDADLEYHRRRQMELAGRHPLLSRLKGSLGGREE